MRQRVVMTAALPEDAVQILSRDFEVVVHETAPRTEEDLVAFLAEADGAVTLLSDPVSRRVLASNPNLRVVANYAVGTNNIDLEAARDLGVVVVNTPGVLTDATADLTMALVLAITRRIVEGDKMVREGRFEGWQPLLLLGTSLAGKKLGIVGMGRIGTAVAKRARAFGMEIVYTSRSARVDLDPELAAVRTDLRTLLEICDIVSLHCPLTAETRHLIGPEELALMKPSAYLINTSRGAIVDEKALAAALEGKRIRGAALDVFENEPAVEPALRSLANVVMAPHLGSATEETRREMARMVAIDITRVLHGGGPLHPVVFQEKK